MRGRFLATFEHLEAVRPEDSPLKILRCMGNISSLLLKLDRVGFLSFMSKRVLTKALPIKAEEKTISAILYFQIDEWTVSQPTVK